MVSFSILDSGKIVRELLLGSTFDDWKIIKAKISMLSTFVIEGNKNKEFEEDGDEFVNFFTVKKVVYEIIRGDKKPTDMEISLKRENLFDTDRHNFIVNIRINKEKMSLNALASPKTFDLDRKYDVLWGDYIKELLKSLGIAYLVEE